MTYLPPQSIGWCLSSRWEVPQSSTMSVARRSRLQKKGACARAFRRRWPYPRHASAIRPKIVIS